MQIFNLYFQNLRHVDNEPEISEENAIFIF